MAVKYFDWDDSKNASSGRNGIGFEDIVFHIERGGLLDILEHPKPDRYAQPASSSSGARTTCTSYRLSRTTHGVPETIIPSRKATKEYLGEESDDEA